MRFSASFDWLTILITAGLALFLGSVFSAMYFLGHVPIDFVLPPVILFSVFYILVYGFSCQAYEVTDEEVIIIRPFKNKAYLIEDIMMADALPREAMRWTMRLFGDGGLFGYYGFFTNHWVGPMRLYATRRTNYVLLQVRGNKHVVFTPDDPEGLVKKIHEKIRKKSFEPYNYD